MSRGGKGNRQNGILEEPRECTFCVLDLKKNKKDGSSYLVSNKAVRSGLGLEVPYHETRIHGPSGCALGAGRGGGGQVA